MSGNDCLEKLSLVCGALSGFDGASLQALGEGGSSAGGRAQRTPKRGRGGADRETDSRYDADGDGGQGPHAKRAAYDVLQDGADRRSGGTGADGAPTQAHGGRPAGKQTRRVPDERRKLSRQISAYLRFGVLSLPEGSNIKLNNKAKKGGGGDSGTSEYRGAFNTLLQLVFGDSLAPWSHVTNWLYLHAGEASLYHRSPTP